MQTLTKEELSQRKILYCRKILQDVFIYPTDTVYGIGCDATNGVLVEKIRELKQRENMPFSVIAPSKEWIEQVCEVDELAQEWLDKLPGPYTLILRIKDHIKLPRKVTCGAETLGVRIPDHWISACVAELKKPIITTSANVHGENYMRTSDDVPDSWRHKIPFMIEEGELHNKPSTIIDLSGKEPKISRN